MAFDSALAPYREQMGFLETADTAKWAKNADVARLAEVYRNVRSAWYHLVKAREDLMMCLGLKSFDAGENAPKLTPPPDKVLNFVTMGSQD